MQLSEIVSKWRIGRLSINLIIITALICVIGVSHSPTLVLAADAFDLYVDDSMSLIHSGTGTHCIATADTGLAHLSASTIEIDIQGTLLKAYVFWSGRDYGNLGDNSILLNDTEIFAEAENHGESGGGSWWHTYMGDATSLIRELDGNQGAPDQPLTLTVSGLAISDSMGGENHGVGLLVIYDSADCEERATNIHFGLDSFKLTAPAPMYGPHSALHCTKIEPSSESRQIDFSLYIGGISNESRNATIWLMTATDTTMPSTLIGQPTALSYIDPVGNDSEQRQWDHFSTSIELPPNHTQACIQVESMAPTGVSGVIVSFAAQLHLSQEPITNRLYGKVWLDSNSNGEIDAEEQGISNIVVLLRDTVSHTVQQAFVTGPTGDFRFVCTSESEYTVDIAEELFEQPLVQTADPDDILDTETIVSFPPATIENVNFGFAEASLLGTISGSVWRDINGNSTRDEPQDDGISQAGLLLLDSQQNLVAEHVTDESGEFVFTDLEPDNYFVQLQLGTNNEGLLQSFESDGSLDGLISVDLTDTLIHAEVEFGYGMKGRIGGRLWHDADGDGVQAEAEAGIDNALILFRDIAGEGRVAATQNGGFYLLEDLLPGEYSVLIVQDTIPTNAVLTSDPDGTLDGIATVQVAISSVITDVNFGFEFGVGGVSQDLPLIDLSATGIDLNDEQALIDYLILQMQAQIEVQLTIQSEAIEGSTSADPLIDNSMTIDNQPGVEDEFQLPDANTGSGNQSVDESPQVDEVHETNDNDDIEGNDGNAFVIHLPVVQ